MLQDHLPVNFKDPKFMRIRHEAFILLKLFHNLFAINFFCVVEIIIELFVCHSRYNRNFKVTNIILYMYLFMEIS